MQVKGQLDFPTFECKAPGAMLFAKYRVVPSELLCRGFYRTMLRALPVPD
jgi:hypothetical protein